MHADHKYLTHPETVYENACAIRQRMHIEEFSPKILHMKGDNNNVADVMSRIPQKKEMLASEEIFSSIEEYHANARAKLGIKDKKNNFFKNVLWT